MGITLEDISKLKGAKITNEKALGSIEFTGVSIDSRKCRKSDLFFAIKGEKFDGHDFVVKVLKEGCKCAVVSERWFAKNSGKLGSLKNKSFIIVKDTETALGGLANIHRNKFILPVIAVAGSNGKTSTKDFAAHVLSKKYNVLKTEGNLNNQIGVPLTLFRLNSRHEMAVVEVGTNHFGEIESLCKILEPQFGIITNIGKEHLEFLINIRGAAKAEGELVKYLESVYGTFFLNADDKYLQEYRKSENIKKFSYGFQVRTEVKGKINKFNRFYPEVEIKYGKKVIKAQLKNIGYQSCKAALSAAAVGFYFEVPVHDIKKAVSEYEIESNRRNQLKSVNGVWVIDDTYNSNPDSVNAALENLSAYRMQGKRYIVLGDMLELGPASSREHKAIGKNIRKMKFDNLLTYGKFSYNTFLGAKGVKNNFHFEDKAVLSGFLKMNLKKGDVVLVKGSRSMKMEEVIENISVN
jgi:UDP-N-acetylmuramoyl-tripeptide--D-alanyl-D-alanine ligase